MVFDGKSAAMHPGESVIPPIRDALAAGAVFGALGGLASGLADTASTVLWLPAGYDQLRLTFSLASIGAASGALVASGLAGADALLARRVPSLVRRHALLLAAPLAAVAHLLFTGGMMRRLPARWALVPIAWVALVAGTALATALLRRALSRAMASSRARRAASAAVFLVAALALHGVDHRVLPRLYEYLHAGLGALTAVCFGAAALCASPSLARPSRRAGLAAGALSLALGVVGYTRLDAWPNVRAEVFGAHAPFVRHVALALGALRPQPSNPLGDPEAIRRAQEALGGARASARGMPVRPFAHLLLITVDAMRADRLGRVVDGRSLTPNLDALAAESVVFERAITQAPHSSYAISSLHTGEYLHETIPLGQQQPLPTIAATLRARGWNTAALYTRGIFFTEGERLLPYRDSDFGFARASNVDREATAQTDAAITEIDDAARRGGPTFVWVHYFDVHAPYHGAGDTPVARYDDAVRLVDREAMRLISHARRALRGDVVVALTADHGEEFGEHGGVYHGSTLYEEQLRVPLVVSVPGVRGRRVPGRVGAQLVDLAPTLTALLGVSAPASMRGNDLRRWMIDAPNYDDAPPVFAAVNSRRAVVRWPWKLVVDLTYGVEELIDLSEDPLERRNRAGAAPGPRAELRALLGAWLSGLSAGAHENPAIAQGRLGDRDAIPGLVALARATREPVARRVEALELLSRFGAAQVREGIAPLLNDRDARVRATAAIALGNARDPRAASTLRDVVAGEDPGLRARAGIALAALGDEAAVDALIDALSSRDEALVLDAVKSLGALRDRRAVEPLLAALADDHVRYRAVISLGQIGDPRAYDAVRAIAERDPTDDAQANATLALGLLRDRRAVPMLVERVARGRDAGVAAGALVALGAVGDDVAGFDAARFSAAPPPGFSRCAPYREGGLFGHLALHACVSGPGASSLTLPIRGAVRGPAVIMLRARRDDGPAVDATLRAGARELGRIHLTARWDTARIAVPSLPPGPLTLVVEGAPTVHVAHAVAAPTGG